MEPIRRRRPGTRNQPGGVLLQRRATGRRFFAPTAKQFRGLQHIPVVVGVQFVAVQRRRRKFQVLHFAQEEPQRRLGHLGGFRDGARARAAFPRRRLRLPAVPIPPARRPRPRAEIRHGIRVVPACAAFVHGKFLLSRCGLRKSGHEGHGEGPGLGRNPAALRHAALPAPQPPPEPCPAADPPKPPCEAPVDACPPNPPSPPETPAAATRPEAYPGDEVKPLP